MPRTYYQDTEFKADGHLMPKLIGKRHERFKSMECGRIDTIDVF